MKKWNLVDQSLTPDGQNISLWEHDGSHAIRVGAEELMSTRQFASEERVAELACAGLKAKRRVRVLVGGLGFGFTLRAALASLGADAEVVTAELMPAVIAWNRNPELPLASESLADRRVRVVERDVAEVIRSVRGEFDSIILDVDNGPVALTTSGNQVLYEDEGLRLIRAALRPGGCAAFWSAAPNARFEKALGRCGFTVELQKCRAHKDSGRWHTIFLARR